MHYVIQRWVGSEHCETWDRGDDRSASMVLAKNLSDIHRDSMIYMRAYEGATETGFRVYHAGQFHSQTGRTKPPPEPKEIP